MDPGAHTLLEARWDAPGTVVSGAQRSIRHSGAYHGMRHSGTPLDERR